MSAKLILESNKTYYLNKYDYFQLSTVNILFIIFILSINNSNPTWSILFLHMSVCCMQVYTCVLGLACMWRTEVGAETSSFNYLCTLFFSEVGSITEPKLTISTRVDGH